MYWGEKEREGGKRRESGRERERERERGSPCLQVHVYVSSIVGTRSEVTNGTLCTVIAQAIFLGGLLSLCSMLDLFA